MTDLDDKNASQHRRPAIMKLRNLLVRARSVIVPILAFGILFVLHSFTDKDPVHRFVELKHQAHLAQEYYFSNSSAPHEFVFEETNPKFIHHFFATQTATESEQLGRYLVGKWIKITARIYSIHPRFWPPGVYVAAAREDFDSPYLRMGFGWAQDRAFSKLAVRDTISTSCEIVEVSLELLGLDNCALDK